MAVEKALILAAGLASRLMPATKAVSKPMLPLVNKPTIQYLVEEIVQSGIHDVAIVVNKDETLVKNHFTKNEKLNSFVKERGKEELLDVFAKVESLADITYIEQEKPLGPGDAVLKARPFLEEKPFALLYSDDIVISKTPATRQLIDSYEECNCPVVAVTPKPDAELKHFGVIKAKTDPDVNPILVEAIVEKPKDNPPSNLAVIGRYILTNETMKILSNIPYNMGHELLVTTALEEHVRKEKLYANNLKGTWYTTGKKLDYVVANIACALENPELKEPLMSYMAKVVK